MACYRYIDLLDKEKRHLGGVLAATCSSSNTGNNERLRPLTAAAAIAAAPSSPAAGGKAPACEMQGYSSQYSSLSQGLKEQHRPGRWHGQINHCRDSVDAGVCPLGNGFNGSSAGTYNARSRSACIQEEKQQSHSSNSSSALTSRHEQQQQQQWDGGGGHGKGDAPAMVKRGPRTRVQFGDVVRTVERRRSRSVDGTAWSAGSRSLDSQQALAAAASAGGGGMVWPGTAIVSQGVAGGAGAGCLSARNSRERSGTTAAACFTSGAVAAETIRGGGLLQASAAASTPRSGSYNSSGSLVAAMKKWPA